MCGIAGLLYPEAGPTSPGPQRLAEMLALMNAAIAHRGPDGEATWTTADGRVGLAHRRLAIVDLSTDANQPMADASGRLHVTFNGEIYNHMALRHELQDAGYDFRTDHSDTEVLLHGYAAWGLDGLLARLEGMFAFALWDAERRVLSLARDRIGIKPLYFTRLGGVFRFASEIKAMLTDPSLPRDTDPAALNHYLSFMVAPAPLTMFQGIYKLPAAHLMEVELSSGKVSTRRYWDAVPGRGIDASETAGLSPKALEAFYRDGIRSRLEAAIEKRMMSDVPFGVFLSGGIDSSANVALMSQISSQPVKTFTVGFKDHQHLNELDYADRVAREFKTEHHQVLIDGDDMQGYLADLVHHQDEPIADWVCVPLYFVSKLAKDNGVTVVQVGEGSDEQFCGYQSWMQYLSMYRKFWPAYTGSVPAPLRRLLGSAAAALAPASRGRGAQFAEAIYRAGAGHELFWSGANAFWNVHKAKLFDAAPSAGWSDLEDTGLDLSGLASADSGDVISGYLNGFDADHPDADALTRMIYSEFRLRLPELLLMRVDKIAMSTSIEGRVPFLDHDLVEFTMDIPMDAKVPGRNPKQLLKSAMAGLLPDEIIHRPKMGFAAPVAEWLRDEFGRDAEATVMGSPVLENFGLSKPRIGELFRQHRDNRDDHALHLWTLLNLTSWHDHWIGSA